MKTYSFTVELTERDLQNILHYGDRLLGDLTEDQIDAILKSISKSTYERLIDEPHYAYEDNVEGVID